jgi:hypothetical protein
LRQWIRRRRSDGWVRVRATVEGYELLLARENGWFIVFYSYDFEGRRYSGELRQWLLFSFSSQEAQTDKVIQRFPRGAMVEVRVNPEDPNQSVSEP